MSQRTYNESICLKKYLTDKDYNEIKALRELCSATDRINLKLELEYRRSLYKDLGSGLKSIDEFLYYADDMLISYLSISCFGGNIGEITGMTHPDWRRKGAFTKLYELAGTELMRRNFSKVLLLSDGRSDTGLGFIQSVGGVYDFSEYHMRLNHPPSFPGNGPVSLRRADIKDQKEICRQNALYFDDVGEEDSFPGEIDLSNETTYLVQRNNEVIGKIKVERNGNSSYISGFGILPEYRGKGYGRAALGETLRLLEETGVEEFDLDAECRNQSALNLYTSYGFKETSVMDYYKIS